MYCEGFIKNFFKETTNTLALNPGTTQFRVIPWNYESPNHSPRQLIVNPEYVANASPKGWHDTNSLTGTTSTLTYSITSASCNQANGSATVTASGGAPGAYSYLWSAGSTTNVQGSIAAGTYTILVTDANNCTSNLSVSIANPINGISSSSICFVNLIASIT